MKRLLPAMVLLVCFLLTPPSLSAQSGVGATFAELTVGETTYRDVVVTQVYPDRLSVTHAAGLANLSFDRLPEEIQQQFQYDPARAEEYRKEQAQQQTLAEQKRIAQLQLQAERLRQARAEEEKLRQEQAAATPVPQPIDPLREPVFNGLPLTEILNRGIIANRRAPVYSLSGGDQPYRDALETINAKYPGALLRNGSGERYEAFQALTKTGGHPGTLIGYVRPGFLFQNLPRKYTESAPIAMPRDIGGVRFGSINHDDFHALGSEKMRQWWNESRHDPMAHIPQTWRFSF